MMKIILRILIAVLAFSICSCESRDGFARPFEYTTTGIKLKKKDAFLKTARIDSDGIEFTITPTPQHTEEECSDIDRCPCYDMSLRINHNPVKLSYNPEYESDDYLWVNKGFDTSHVYSGEWGEIGRDHNYPWTITVKILPNDSPEDRIFSIEFSWCNNVSYIDVTQDGKSE